MLHALLLLVSVVALLPGLAGVLLPILPGLPYMFGITVVFGFIDQFSHLTGRELLILGILTLISVGVDYGSGVLGAKLGGASQKAMGWGLLGMLVGMILLPPFGGILGLFVGVMAAEIKNSHNQHRAIKAATGTLIGTFAGMTINVILALIFILLFVIFALT